MSRKLKKFMTVTMLFGLVAALAVGSVGTYAHAANGTGALKETEGWRL